MITESDLLAARSFGGMDLAAKEDTVAFVLLFVLGQIKYVKSWFWCPQAKIDSELAEGRKLYAECAEAGDIFVQEGTRIEQEPIYEFAKEKLLYYHPEKIVVDTWGMQWLGPKLNELVEVIEFGTGFPAFTDSTKELKADISAKRFFHDGNKMMSWQIANVVVREDDKERVYPIKKGKTRRYKIDGPVALIMAQDGYLRGDDGPPEDVSIDIL